MHPSMQMQVYPCNARASRWSRFVIVYMFRKIFFDLDVSKDACLVDGAASPMCIADCKTLAQNETCSVGANSDQAAKALRSGVTIIHAIVPGEISIEILETKTAPSSCRDHGPAMRTTRGAVD